MKALFTLLLFAVSAPATAQTAEAIYKQACGPLDAEFVVQQVKGQPPAAPEPGKALVYFIQKESGFVFTTRVGLDGAWEGVLQRDSYIFFSVAPGEHHACAATLNRKRPEAEFFDFATEAGKTYYYLVRSIINSSDIKELGPGGRNEALFLIATDPQSVTKPKQ